ncbi:hypothetical protein F0L68_01200 [Solihabitans fulvus]|uniref:Uncharacterized protein n=1 Tax=Solihabitans fulvus TaxID=1892852 RepID=A0A5B2XWA5_9PSEU|nr:hypothetical protein [Solihabitans fulvus]KAA2267172.1 hypothetical protein F0L68_01200 [Solihabitans fulvus]
MPQISMNFGHVDEKVGTLRSVKQENWDTALNHQFRYDQDAAEEVLADGTGMVRVDDQRSWLQGYDHHVETAEVFASKTTAARDVLNQALTNSMRLFSS